MLKVIIKFRIKLIKICQIVTIYCMSYTHWAYVSHTICSGFSLSAWVWANYLNVVLSFIVEQVLAQWSLPCCPPPAPCVFACCAAFLLQDVSEFRGCGPRWGASSSSRDCRNDTWGGSLPHPHPEARSKRVVSPGRKQGRRVHRLHARTSFATWRALIMHAYYVAASHSSRRSALSEMEVYLHCFK